MKSYITRREIREINRKLFAHDIISSDYSESAIDEIISGIIQRYNPEDVGYMVISNMMAGNYRGFWAESKEHGVNEGYTPSDSFEGYAVDDNGGMLPINNLKMIVTFSAAHPEYFDQLPPEIKKSVEDARKYFEEHDLPYVYRCHKFDKEWLTLLDRFSSNAKDEEIKKIILIYKIQNEIHYKRIRIKKFS